MRPILPLMSSLRKEKVEFISSPCLHIVVTDYNPLTLGFILYSRHITMLPLATRCYITPGKTVTIYNDAEIARIAFNNTMSRKNMLSGFQKTGIFSFNDKIFTDDD